jgi:hypothetical protein
MTNTRTCNHTTNERNELLDQGFCPVCANRDFARLRADLKSSDECVIRANNEAIRLRAENERLIAALKSIVKHTRQFLPGRWRPSSEYNYARTESGGMK